MRWLRAFVGVLGLLLVMVALTPRAEAAPILRLRRRSSKLEEQSSMTTGRPRRPPEPAPCRDL